MPLTLLRTAARKLSRVARPYDIDSLDNRDPELMRRLERYLGWAVKSYFRAEVRGVERIPQGAGLYVGNHNASPISPEMYILGGAVFRKRGIDDVPYGLGHEVTLSLPIANAIAARLGGVRASHENAHRLFALGRKVLVYPGGDVEAMRPYHRRNRIDFAGRRGYVRLALHQRVPIIPVVTAGAHSVCLVLHDMRWLAQRFPLARAMRLKVWPLTFSIPWGLTLGPLPFFIPLPARILMEILEPIVFERTGPEAADDAHYVEDCARRVESTMQEALDNLALEREGRLPEGPPAAGPFESGLPPPPPIVAQGARGLRDLEERLG